MPRLFRVTFLPYATVVEPTTLKAERADRRHGLAYAALCVDAADADTARDAARCHLSANRGTVADRSGVPVLYPDAGA